MFLHHPLRVVHHHHLLPHLHRRQNLGRIYVEPIADDRMVAVVDTMSMYPNAVSSVRVLMMIERGMLL